MKLLVSTIAPYHWVKLDRNDRPVERGQFIEAAFISTVPRDVGTVIGVAPAHATTFHSVDIPTRKRSNMLAAVPYALEENLSEELEDLHFTLCDWTPGQSAQVLVVARDALEGWLALFRDAGVRLDGIIPELSLVPIHPDSEATLVRTAPDQYLVKTGTYSGFCCDHEAFDYWWGDENNRSLQLAVEEQALAVELNQGGGEGVSHWGIGKDFASWLEHATGQLKSAPSMLQGDYEPEHLKPRDSLLNIAAGIAVLALLLLGASHWYEAARLDQRLQDNQQAIRALFEQAFPGEEYLDSPRRQIASLLSISEGDPVDETFQYLLGVSASAAPQHSAQLEEINYRDRQLQIGVSVPNFAALEKLTDQINAQADLQAVLISSGARDQRVTGQIKIAVSG